MTGVFLHLFHGRNTVGEDMDDWGDDGPKIGPLEYVHTTYMSDLKLACSYEIARKFFPEKAQEHAMYASRNNHSVDAYPVDLHLNVTEGLIEYDGKFWGDWSVSVPDRTDYPRVDDDSWIDLREGEDAIVTGRVYAANEDGLIVTLSSWVDLVISGDCRHIKGAMDRTLIVTRTEDGLIFKGLYHG